MAIQVTRFESHKDEVLSELGKKVQMALEEIGAVGETAVKKVTPVGTPESTGKPGYRGGTLRNSISHMVVGDNEVDIGTDVEYAPYVELGTVKMTKKPYLKPGIENNIGVFKEIVEAALK